MVKRMEWGRGPGDQSEQVQETNLPFAQVFPSLGPEDSEPGAKLDESSRADWGG